MPIKVSGLYIYPIKSLKGISVDSAEALSEGFVNDRRLMLVDEEGRFLSQRENALMALFKTEISGHNIIVKYLEKTIAIPLKGDAASTERSVSIWDSKLRAYSISKSIDEWFSDALDQSVSLVFMGKKSERIKRFLKPPFSSKVSLADGYPYLILGKGSLNELNSKCPEHIPLDRFRANIVLDTTEAHSEDEWRDIRLGDASLKHIKACARCIITTIDQDNSSKSKEPLKTLASYRKRQNNIYFGSNYICTKPGLIHVGDELKIEP